MKAPQRVLSKSLVASGVVLGSLVFVGPSALAGIGDGCELGTDNDPDLEWEVASLADLEILETDAADCSGLDIFQTSDIDLDGLATPINNWHGTFDGNGFQLIDSNRASAEPTLFGSPDGDIDIINVIRLGDVSGGTDVGGLIGQTSDAVTITNSYTTGTTTGSFDVGGFIGRASGAVTITNSYTTGDTTGDIEVGGLIGSSNGTVEITNSYTTGSTTGFIRVGGLIGQTSDAVTITNSYTTGTSTGDIWVAGLIGSSNGTVEITNSYTTGTSTGDIYIGGLIGSSNGTVEITNSYTTGDTSGDIAVGGFIGRNNDSVTITNSYTTGDTTGDIEVGGLVGSNFATITITNLYTTGNTTEGGTYGSLVGFDFGLTTVSGIFCLDSNPACLPPLGIPASAVELQTESFLTGWDFSSVWCFRANLNDGFPVLRSITFGPGDTNNCRSARASRRDVTFDPAGGSCADHTSTWTVRFRGSYTLPAATDCTRDGYIFLGWTRDPALTAPENLLTPRVARSGSLTAVWGQLPTAPTKVDVLANFLCRQNCNSAFVIWPTSSNPSDTAVITLDGSDTTCSTSGETSGLMWCWITGLASGSAHTTSVAWRNQHGPSPATSAVFDLR